jgi:predicted dehydrogenase
MAKTLRWGILSTARINQALLDPIKKASRSQLAAVASRDLAKAQAYAKEHGIPKAYGSYEALLADPDIDVIYNPLPNTMHKEWTVKAAQAGKHVLCEKPIVTTLPELDEIEAAAAANNVTVFEAFMYLHHPQTLKALEMIKAGVLGKLQLIVSKFSYYLPPEQTGNIRLYPELGGGSLWDVGVYPNSLAIVMAQAGAPEEVWAGQLIGETGIDVSMVGQLKFANGVVAQISCGFRSPFRQGAEIVGEKGLIKIAEPWKPNTGGKNCRLELYTGDDDPAETIVFKAAGNNPYLCEVQAMEACVLDGAQPVVPLSLSRHFLRTVLALYQSAKTGQVVTL